MDSFKLHYQDSCSQLDTEPIKSIIDFLSEKKDKASSTLNLSGLSIPLKPCTALANTLATDGFFTKIILADAFLGDDGCIKIANALKTNTTVTHLDLRGNSIRSDGAIALGQMLRVNNHLIQYFCCNLVLIWSGIVSVFGNLESAP